jgi:hypothetical protein
MRYFILVTLIFLFALLGLSSAKQKISTISTVFEPIAVVELFTSQGCSSCTAADKLLTKIIADVKNNHKNIYALSYHVDYWNRLGWADPFSHKKFSERQANYVSMLNTNAYTPQIIVNGNNVFVGSNENLLEKAIEKALNTQALVHFTTFASSTIEDVIKIKYALAGNFAGCKINIVLISKKETTHIKRGENEGLTLMNENIVLELNTQNAAQEGEIKLKPATNKNNTAIVAFVQQKDYKIIGAAMQNLNIE